MATERESRLSRIDPTFDLEPFFGGSGMGRLMEGMLGRSAARTGAWLPAVDVNESDLAFVVTAELPGAKSEDITVEGHGDLLTIRGEKRSERDEKDEHRRLIERSYGSFSRSFTLPPTADGDRVEADFKDGVLTITIPKQEEHKPRTVPIRS
ncbi:MAG: Hsp20/alpha crystallin family protein [bacterium]|nr:Hsp20/alpha crystallin family protein [bacterium]MCP5067855.1 Hsp20/alpha crystallin family protein [bacterium]